MLPFAQEEEMEACTDGVFLGKRYFTCPNRRGFFVHLHNCLPDSRFTSVQNAECKRLSGVGKYLLYANLCIALQPERLGDK